MKIPLVPAEITPKWLTEALQTSGIIEQARAAIVNLAFLSDDQGFTGQLVRLRVHYDPDEDGAPRSIIAKFPTTDPQVREFIFTVTRHYQREAQFYEQVADKISLRVPKLYYSSMDVAARKSLLLIEDLAPARTLDKVVGCPPKEAELAIRALARLHADWWENSALADLAKIAFDNPTFAQQMQHLYQESWELFRARMGNRLPEAFVAIGQQLGKHLTHVRTQLLKPPRTLLHRDFQLDNLLFAPSGIDDAPAFIDWQLMSVGCGTQEVACFVGTNMSLEGRRGAEEVLLRMYFATLKEFGVKDYTFEQCLVDYRLSLCNAFADLVVGSVKGDLSEQQEQTVYELIAPRCMAAILDHDADHLLPP